MYARVSTEKQKTERQLDDLRGFVERMGWDSIEYLETESSEKRRPVLERMMDDARLKKFDVVIVWKLDRIARSMKQLIEIVLELDKRGIRFLSMQGDIDSDQKDPMGRFLLHLFAALAELERGIIVERVKAGVAQAKRSGKHCGRPKRVFRRDEAAQMRQRGMSWRAISKALDVPQATLRLALSGCAESLAPRPPKP